MSRAGPLSIVDLPPPSARRVPRPSRGGGWNTLAGIEAFVSAVEAELEAMDRGRVGVHRRGRKPDLALRRRLIWPIWSLTSGGMRWRIAGWLSGVPSTTLHSSFARWTRLGQRLRGRALRRGGARARHPRRGLARRHAGRAIHTKRDQVGGGAAVRLAEPLPAARHRVRSRARPLCRTHL